MSIDQASPFEEAEDNAEECEGTLLVKATLEEVADYLNGVIVESARTRLKQGSAEAVKTLPPYEEDIAKEIAAIGELTEQDLGQGFYLELAIEGGSRGT
jgi:hypothetical protein